MSDETRELTYGEKAVGLTFNPGGNEKVDTVKRAYASIIDLVNSLPVTASNDEKSKLIEEAIRQAQTAQMWAVKAITFQF